MPAGWRPHPPSGFVFTAIVTPDTNVRGWKFTANGGVLVTCGRCGAAHLLGDDFQIDRKSGILPPHFVCLNTACDNECVLTLSGFDAEYQNQIELCIEAANERKPKVKG